MASVETTSDHVLLSQCRDQPLIGTIPSKVSLRTSKYIHPLVKAMGTADDLNCSHIISALIPKDSEEGDFVKKYKSVVSWYSHRSSQTHQPSKRRKVNYFVWLYLVLSSYFSGIDCCTNMWDLRYCTVSPICLLSMFVCRVLVGPTCRHTSKRIGSYVLCVTPFLFLRTRHLLVTLGYEQASMLKVDLFTVLNATILSIIQNSMHYTLLQL